MTELEVRKISNGYILRINGREVFCDTPEVICGETSAWVLERCRDLDNPPAAKTVADAKYQAEFLRSLAEVQQKTYGVSGKVRLENK